MGCMLFWSDASCSRLSSFPIFLVCHLSCTMLIVPARPNFCRIVCFSVFCADVVPYLFSSALVIFDWYSFLAEGFSSYAVCVFLNSAAVSVFAQVVFLSGFSLIAFVSCVCHVDGWFAGLLNFFIAFLGLSCCLSPCL